MMRIRTAFALAVGIALTAAACEPDTRATGSPGTGSMDPFVSIHAQLNGDARERDLFTVRADQAEYWRMYTLDQFDGSTWTSTKLNGSEDGLAVSVPGPLGQTGPRPPVSATLDQTFTIVGELPGQGALPMAQSPVEIIDGQLGDVSWDAAHGQVSIDGRLEPGIEYSVRSRIVVPSANELDNLQFDPAADDGPWTQLPDDVDPRITQIAHAWTHAEDNDYRRVLAIQQHFQGNGFTYSDDVEPIQGQDALVEFLTVDKEGFCQHYASAMAVLVRALGLPARIAVGFRTGTRLEDGSYMVRTTDAHVWVEVLFPRYGWLPFEPETGSVLPAAAPGSYLDPLAPAALS